MEITKALGLNVSRVAEKAERWVGKRVRERSRNDEAWGEVEKLVEKGGRRDGKLSICVWEGFRNVEISTLY